MTIKHVEWIVVSSLSGKMAESHVVQFGELMAECQLRITLETMMKEQSLNCVVDREMVDDEESQELTTTHGNGAKHTR